MRLLCLIILFVAEPLLAVDARRCLNLEILGRKQATGLMNPTGTGDSCSTTQDQALVILSQLDRMKTIFPQSADQSCWYMGALHGVQIRLQASCEGAVNPGTLHACADQAKDLLHGSCSTNQLDEQKLLELHQWAEDADDPVACYEGITTVLAGLGKGEYCE